MPDSLTREFRTRNGRIVHDGGGIEPDIKIEPDSLPNITYYLQRVDTTDLMFNYVVDYIKNHPTIAPASEFEISDADYEEFKQRVINSNFTYDRVSEKCLEELVKLAKFEGYYEDAKPEFEALEKKLKHNIAKDLDFDYNKQKIKQMLTSDIITAYYFQRGALENSLRYDKQLKEAIRLLKSPEEYAATLQPKAEKKE